MGTVSDSAIGAELGPFLATFSEARNMKRFMHFQINEKEREITSERPEF